MGFVGAELVVYGWQVVSSRSLSTSEELVWVEAAVILVAVEHIVVGELPTSEGLSVTWVERYISSSRNSSKSPSVKNTLWFGRRHGSLSCRVKAARYCPASPVLLDSAVETRSVVCCVDGYSVLVFQ